MRTASLQNFKRLKDHMGGTLNDIVMAACTGALRAYLIEHNALPDEPLQAMVPVSIAGSDCVSAPNAMLASEGRYKSESCSSPARAEAPFIDEFLSMLSVRMTRPRERGPHAHQLTLIN